MKFPRPAPIKRQLIDGLSVAGDFAGLLATALGTAVTAFFGKLYLAFILAGIALGFFLRLSNRRRAVLRQEPTPPFWIYPTAGLSAAVITAILVEVTSLPYRFYQQGFQYWHMLIIAGVLLASFALALRVCKKLAIRQSISSTKDIL
jgi:F0F1-type ATP synthase membrane subunit a